MSGISPNGEMRPMLDVSGDDRVLHEVVGRAYKCCDAVCLIVMVRYGDDCRLAF